MYALRPHQDSELRSLHEHMQQTRLAVLVSHGAQGLLATHLPVLLDTGLGESGTVLAHMARANPQWRDLQEGGEAMLVFPGVDAYVSPSFYPSKASNPKVVPTWNYTAVHAYGPVEVIHEDSALLDIVTHLTERHEARREQPWRITDAPSDYLEGMLRAIVGIRLPIARLQGVRKLSQNRSVDDLRGVRDALASSADPLDQSIAAQMRTL
ncbi:FMN-binding negative transcriptional regulator [Pseudomonas sp. S75]|uniref:FMN-binding negative transcriptional regulator n=1 Tax=unclassified Pseudomonas TaxID=196821 RepID=UPI0019079BCA|nr:MULTISPECIES: FMN-binding negative transcriptional regulator [unclassified Pseudomonas]MBJ9974406.1 FMN-binding negative transcriptional regulator [Pseudomonas sp. S30]MBK0154285.1 FMN-binding negative transcriptional regulator [Pseudomonas sp. S75]